jgi:HlyD family secretion protein
LTPEVPLSFSRSKFSFIGLAVLAAVSLPLWTRSRNAIPVQVVPVRIGRVASTITSTTSGSVEPRLRATINAELSARVVRERAREGDRLAKGAAVISLDPEEPREELAVALANLEAARARLAQAEVKLEDANRELRRTEALYAQKVLSSQTMDAAEIQAKVARRGVEEERASSAQPERTASLSRIRLRKAEARAPFDGVITRIHVDEGDSVTLGTPLFEIADDSSTHVEAPIDEIDAARVRVRQRAGLIPDAFPDQTFFGRIIEVAPVVSTGVETNRTVTIKVGIDPDGETGLERSGSFKIGMSVDVEVILAEESAALYVPTFAVIERGGRSLVLVAEGSRAQERAIEKGLSNWETTQVKSCLSEGERVITTLNDKKLRDGARIRVETTEGGTARKKG